MASTPPTDEAFLREVDEELRRDQLQTIWQRYGRLLLAAIGLALAGLAGYLIWTAQATQKAEAQGEQLSAAIASLQANKPTDASKKIDPLVDDGTAAYRVAATFAKAAIHSQKNETKQAVALYAGIAANGDNAQPFRDLALIRQTLLEFDTLPPQQVIDRMKPLAVEGAPWFGTAGELSALALIKAKRPAEAGRLLATISADKKLPPALRLRTARLANSLGADVALPSADKE